MGSYQQISNTTVAGSSTSTITFSGIPQSFSHLVVRSYARSLANGVADDMAFRINGNTSAVYDMIRGIAYGVTGPSATQISGNSYNNTAYNWIVLPGNTSTANNFGMCEITIPNYVSSTLNKEALLRYVWIDTANAGGQTAYGGLAYRNTSAITSVSLTCSNNFAAGSTFYLYGIS